ncbi:MAG TPA: hypothetical protein VLM37_08620 [Fibrobacteraceae bacterium]|nr:hypothetical protein [Fibrobacteraceae bacterium]
MDLRQRAGRVQITLEKIIRFRIPILFVFILIWWLWAASWQDTVGILLGVAEREAVLMTDLFTGLAGSALEWMRLGLALSLLLLFRWRLSNWQTALTTIVSLVGCFVLCRLLDGTSALLPVLLGAALFLLVTLFFFSHRVFLISGFAAAICLYALASWIPDFSKNDWLWLLLQATLCADLISIQRALQIHLIQGRSPAGSIVQAIQQHLPAVLGTFGVLMGVDILSVLAGQATLHGSSLLKSLAIYLFYVAVILFVSPILFSLSPLHRAQKDTRRRG